MAISAQWVTLLCYAGTLTFQCQPLYPQTLRETEFFSLGVNFANAIAFNYTLNNNNISVEEKLIIPGRFAGHERLLYCNNIPLPYLTS